MKHHTVCIRELVEVRPHPTVVRLDNLDTPNATWLTESFLLTPEVDRHLKALRQLFKRDCGCGVFLIGHYGCGKSHFLAYVIQQLRHSAFGSHAPSPVFLSLINFSSSNRLEDIVAKKLGLEISDGDRRNSWGILLTRQYQHGLLLVLDELSEFLRSKPDSRSFTEDIRFLQFIGEWAQDKRFWVLAAMQEGIEHTGELEYSLYRKIKDRYPLRLLLSPAHVNTLIADSILTKKTGYQTAVDQLAVDISKSLPRPNTDAALLRSIYPLHPATLELLEEVRDRFSQSRGIIDFTVARLQGDPTRGIDAFLDQPWGSLLTPDTIVDHFRDLFEMQPEFIPLAQQVLPWYQKHLDELFAKDALRLLAERLLKLLILVYLSPAREGLSAKKAAQWLLFTSIRADPAKNLSIVQRVLSKMAEQGRYIVEQEQGFRLNIKDDGGAQLNQLLTREIETLQGQDLLVLESLVSLLPGEAFNPFQLPRNKWQHRRLLWHFHERRFGVWFGEERPGKIDGIGLCIRPPWGMSDSVPSLYTIEPAQVTVTKDMIELAALVRLGEQAVNPEVKKNIARRMEERAPTFQNTIRNTWSEATIITIDGKRQASPRLEKDSSTDSWLETLGLWIFRRTYPAFERFAPAYGPLPKDAWLQFMRFAQEDDLGRSDANDYVKLIREAYLVPMGLLRRSGRDYVLPANIEKQELVRLLMPLIEHSPSPKTIHQHLAEPTYGLVPDQINLLLVFLLLQGELDILKDRNSYRDFFETLTNPLHYDRVELGNALTTQQVHAMQNICEGLNIRTPKQWTVLAQRRIVEQLQEIGRKHEQRLQPLITNLQSSGQGKTLLQRLEKQIQQWHALDKGENTLQGFEHFVFEIGSVDGLLEEYHAFDGLVERLPQLIDERRRLQHLLSHPAILGNAKSEIVQEVKILDKAPDLDQADRLEQWLKLARNVYQSYKAQYEDAHQRWWQLQNEHSVWSWQPPGVAASQHLGLDELLGKLDSCRKDVGQQRCRQLVNLDYQPLCTCGFDGNTAPIANTLERFEVLRNEIETQLRLFFQQDEVKSRIRDWKQQGFEIADGTASYLEGSRPIPEVLNISLFDQHLSGVKVAQDVDISIFLDILSKRVWEPSQLKQTLENELSRFEDRRLRFIGLQDRQDITNEMASWCAEQCLRYGAALPETLDRETLSKISESLRPEWVSDAAIANFDSLGLDKKGQDKILGWMLDGHITMPDSCPNPAATVFAVTELLHPRYPSTAEELAIQSESLYLHHHRIHPLASQSWLDRLESLSNTPLPTLATLTDVLKQHSKCQWLMVDCLGLPLLSPVRKLIDSSLVEWKFCQLEFAQVAIDTTTDSCYRQLLNDDINHAFFKCNLIDNLIHQRSLPFAELVKRMTTEFEIMLEPLVSKLNPNLDLLIFSDHGFRLSANGRCYQHGGPSTLERTVPVFLFSRR